MPQKKPTNKLIESLKYSLVVKFVYGRPNYNSKHVLIKNLTIENYIILFTCISILVASFPLKC